MKRVSVRVGAKEIELARAAGKPSIVRDKEVQRAFGIARVDKLYYLPVSATRVSSMVVVDFAVNRTGLQVLTFPPSEGEAESISVLTTTGDLREPNEMVAEKLAEEEFQWSARGVR